MVLICYPSGVVCFSFVPFRGYRPHGPNRRLMAVIGIEIVALKEQHRLQLSLSTQKTLWKAVHGMETKLIINTALRIYPIESLVHGMSSNHDAHLQV
jgi:hypothetical protein